MTKQIEIQTDFIDLVTMQEDESLRVDMVQVENSPKVLYAPMFRIYSPGDPVHKCDGV